MAARNIQITQWRNPRALVEKDCISFLIGSTSENKVCSEIRTEYVFKINLNEINHLLKKKSFSIPAEAIAAILEDQHHIITDILLKGDYSPLIEIIINNRGLGMGKVLRIV